MAETRIAERHRRGRRVLGFHSNYSDSSTGTEAWHTIEVN
jgi:hypothetical protein